MDLRLRRHDGQYRWMLDNGVPRVGGRRRRDRLRRQLRRHPRAQGARGVARRAHPAAAPRRAAPGPVPRHAVARAAQPARADRQRRQRAAHAREHATRSWSACARSSSARSARLGHLIEELIDVTRAAAGADLAGARAGLDRERRPGGGRDEPRQAHAPRGHTLDVDVPDERLFVRGDRGRLAQALVAPDHQRRQVHLRAEHDLDHGPARGEDGRRSRSRTRARASTPKFLPHAFELFAQQDQTLARTLGGLGVGLTLAAPHRPAARRRRRRLQRRARGEAASSSSGCR